MKIVGSSVLGLLIVLFANQQCQAQIIYANSDALNQYLYHYDLTTGVHTQCFDLTGTTTGGTTDVYAIAADDANQLIYWTDNDFLLSTSYSGVTTEIAQVSGDVTSAFGGLAFDSASGIMYTSGNNDDLYTINIATGVTTLIGQVQDDAGATTTMGGLDYDPVSGLLFATNDGAADNLISFDPTSVVGGIINASGVVDYPNADGDIDGLAMGVNGSGDVIAYMINDSSSGAGGGAYAYNVTQGNFEAPFDLEYIDDGGAFSGGAWAPGLIHAIPEPVATPLIALVGFGLMMRRRKK